MNSSLWVPVLVRMILLGMIQVFMLSDIFLTIGDYKFPIFLYPLGTWLVPMGWPSWFKLVLGFVYGLAIDLALGTMGLHAGASVFSAMLALLVLAILEPRDGYEEAEIPSQAYFSLGWVTRFLVIVLFGHILWFNILNFFSPVFFTLIVWHTLISFILSFILIMLTMLITRPKH